MIAQNEIPIHFVLTTSGEHAEYHVRLSEMIFYQYDPSGKPGTWHFADECPDRSRVTQQQSEE